MTFNDCIYKRRMLRVTNGTILKINAKTRVKVQWRLYHKQEYIIFVRAILMRKKYHIYINNYVHVILINIR